LSFPRQSTWKNGCQEPSLVGILDLTDHHNTDGLRANGTRSPSS
jgi:hypothetical protein